MRITSSIVKQAYAPISINTMERQLSALRLLATKCELVCRATIPHTVINKNHKMPIHSNEKTRQPESNQNAKIPISTHNSGKTKNPL